MEARPSICIIPAKGTSRRLPGKNTIDVAGKPALVRVLDILQAAGVFKELFVSSESRDVLKLLVGTKALPLLRAEHLSDENSRIVDVVTDILPKLGSTPYPYYQASRTWVSIALATAVLMLPEDVKGAWELATSFNCPVMVVTKVPYHPSWVMYSKDGFLRPFWPVQSDELRADLELYVDAGCLYIFPPGIFQEYRSFMPPQLKGYVIPRTRGVDINEPQDLELAEALLRARNPQ